MPKYVSVQSFPGDQESHAQWGILARRVSEEDFYYFTGASLVMTSTYAKAALDCQFTRNIPLSSER